MNLLEYDTSSGEIKANFKTRSEIQSEQHSDNLVLNIISQPEPSGPISASWADEVLCGVVTRAYCEAWNLAQSCKHKEISSLAIFISLWKEDKEIISIFLMKLGFDINVIMNDIVASFNCENKVEEQNFYSPIWYDGLMKDAEIARNIACLMYFKRANSLSVIWFYIIHNRGIGQILNSYRHFSFKDIYDAYVYAMNKHMSSHIQDKNKCRLWPLFEE